MGAGNTMTGSKLGGREVMSHRPANQMPSCHGTTMILQHQQAAIAPDLPAGDDYIWKYWSRKTK